MNTHKTHLTLFAIASCFLAACTQSTPSQMNVSQVQLSNETSVEQIPISEVNETNMTTLANQYRKHGDGPIDLTMTYDPKSKKFTAMNAVRALRQVEDTLRRHGVRNITAQTLAVPDGKASLMVTYDIVHALAPADCTPMPGLEHNETGRFLGEYKFGCGVESQFAKQIARPADLKGRSEMGVRDARRDTVILENYSSGATQQPLDGIERDDLASE